MKGDDCIEEKVARKREGEIAHTAVHSENSYSIRALLEILSVQLRSYTRISDIGTDHLRGPDFYRSIPDCTRPTHTAHRSGVRSRSSVV